VGALAIVEEAVDRDVEATADVVLDDGGGEGGDDVPYCQLP